MFALFDPFQAHSSNIMQIKQSIFNNDHVSTCSKDNTVKVWSISDNAWALLRTYDGHTSEVYTLEWVNADTIASGSNDGLYKIWSISTGRTLVSMNTNAESVSCMKLLNNGFHLAIGLSYRTYYAINIYNVNTNMLIASLRGHTDWIYDLAQISDDLLASSSYDETIRIWNLTTNTCKYNLTGHVSRVRSIKQVSIDILLSAGGDQFDNTFKLWNISSGQVISNFKGHRFGTWTLIDLLSDGQTLVNGVCDGVKLWNWRNGECLGMININDGYSISALAVIKHAVSAVAAKQRVY
jgi:WD40 repeat protein